MTDILTDWRYTPDKMGVREKSLALLLKRYGSELNSDGSPKYSNQSIYACAHDWVSQGNMITHGIIKYYEVYYADERYNSVNQGST
jgi:hypothetical protein